jgi:hypothetical protein
MEEKRVRIEVRRFAEDMEEMLRKNDHKGGWERCDREYLERKLDEEVAELKFILLLAERQAQVPVPMPEALREKVIGECADVANIAMMIRDNFGGKRLKEDAGYDLYRM